MPMQNTERDGDQFFLLFFFFCICFLGKFNYTFQSHITNDVHEFTYYYFCYYCFLSNVNNDNLI